MNEGPPISTGFAAMSVLIFAAVNFAGSPPAPAITPDDIRPLLDAICTVESGSPCDPGAVRTVFGDGGKARGPYQIHAGYWKDSRVNCTYEAVDNRDIAERVIIGYMSRYCPKALVGYAETGDLKYAKTIARTHNGGPKGPIKEATEPYWLKVRKHLPCE